jgi:hypothetical protein
MPIAARIAEQLIRMPSALRPSIAVVGPIAPTAMPIPTRSVVTAAPPNAKATATLQIHLLGVFTNSRWCAEIKNIVTRNAQTSTLATLGKRGLKAALNS